MGKSDFKFDFVAGLEIQTECEILRKFEFKGY
jgi:hypothetical protein